MSEKKSPNLNHLAENVYFCPYCKVVSNDFDKFKPVYKYNKWKYRCFARGCGGDFFQHTYNMQGKNGKHYFTTNQEDGNVKEVIERIVISFYKKSLSYRTVAGSTHFSREMIGEIIKNRIRHKSCSYSTFHTEVLGLDKDVDALTVIKKLLDFGVSKRDIMKNLGLDYKAFQKFSEGYVSQSDEKSKVRIENNLVTYSYFPD